MDNLARIQAFKEFSIHNRIDPFFSEDIEAYYDNPHEFSLNLKRSNHQLALYGAAHVSLRQSFFNALDPSQRVALFTSKLTAANILDWVLGQLECSRSDIIDVVDIGKARSIYKFSTHNRSHVIKEKPNNNQSVFHDIARAFQMPFAKSTFIHEHNVNWELTEFLDEDQIFLNKKDALVPLYAKAAAFGDFIELGDRHFENYIAKGEDVVAIDVAHLMEDDNQHWTKSYIAGGLYECCMLQYFTSDLSNFSSVVHLFFESYEAHAIRLFELKSEVSQTVPLIEKINQKWVDARQFIGHMKSIYVSALNNMFDRIGYKQLLIQLVENKLDLNDYQELKMYYLADYQRISTFFRSDELAVDVFMQIRDLAAKKLGITHQYFNDHHQILTQLKDQLTMVQDTNRMVQSH